MNTTKQLTSNARPSTDPFAEYRAARLAAKAQAERNAQADALLNGGARIMGHDSKGLPVQLGTPSLRRGW